MKIALVTCAALPDGTPDDQVLHRELIARGHQPEFVAWDSNAPWSAYDRVVIRSTWDYHRRLPEFLDWATRAKTLNPAETVRWNSTKLYLLSLPVPVVPTTLAADSRFTGTMVVKPAVSATAELTFKVSSQEEFERALSAASVRGDVIVQPFVKSIATDGEVSLMYFRDGYSHAVLKRAKSGDFRVQSDFGGTVEALPASRELLSLGERALAAVPGAWAYARVDIVDWKNEPKIGEIELIEPQLFFRFGSESAGRFERILCNFPVTETPHS